MTSYKLPPLALALWASLACYGQNLVDNGTFATDLSDWTASGSVSYSNFYANGCVAFSASDQPIDAVIQQNFGVDSGDAVSLSFNYARHGLATMEVSAVAEIIDVYTDSVIASVTLTTSNVSGAFTTSTLLALAPSDSLMLKIYDTSASTFGRDFYLNEVAASAITVLPVELLTMSSDRLANQAVELRWSTATETQNDYFIIEKGSGDGTFREIGIMDGAGTSNRVHSYRFVDDAAGTDAVVYRLRQVDWNGSEELVASVRVAAVQTSSHAAVAFPNPCLRTLNVSFPKKHAAFTIRDVRGTLIQRGAANNSGDAVVDVSYLAQGTYVLHSPSGPLTFIKE